MRNDIPIMNDDVVSFLLTFTEWGHADVKEAVSIMKYWDVPFENILSGYGQVAYDMNDIPDIDITKVAYYVVLESISKEFVQSITQVIDESEYTYLCRFIEVEGQYMDCSYMIVENGRWLKWVARHQSVPKRVRRFLREEVMIDEVIE